MRHVFAGVVAALLLCAATTTFAQTFTGAVTGVVKDEQGGILPGVTVTLTGKTGAKTTTTDAAGMTTRSEATIAHAPGARHPFNRFTRTSLVDLQDVQKPSHLRAKPHDRQGR